MTAVDPRTDAARATWYPGDCDVVREVALQMELAACRLAAVQASGCNHPGLAGIECELRRLADAAEALIPQAHREHPARAR